MFQSVLQGAYSAITQERVCRRHAGFSPGGRELDTNRLADVQGLALTKKMLGHVSFYF